MTNDNDPDHPERRSDPFGMGLAAHNAAFAREDCPFPTAYVEGRRWQAGWDQAAFRETPSIAPAPARAPRERRWSPGELVVLAALVRSGEKMSNLASRLGRTKAAIRERCAAQNLPLSDAQDRS
jgi:hypothetical protein